MGATLAELTSSIGTRAKTESSASLLPTKPSAMIRCQTLCFTMLTVVLPLFDPFGRRANAMLMAEYELVRTSRELSTADVLREPLAVHDELGLLQRQARSRSS